jgi:hypothetical protein
LASPSPAWDIPSSLKSGNRCFSCF